MTIVYWMGRLRHRMVVWQIMHVTEAALQQPNSSPVQDLCSIFSLEMNTSA